MANPQNEAVLLRVIELLNEPQLSSEFDQVIAPDWIHHAAFQVPPGTEGITALHDFWHQGFSDFRIIVEKLVSDEDYVAERFRMQGTHTKVFMGIEPTGRSIDITGSGMHRCQNGKLVESWLTPDRLELFRQLGVRQLTEALQQSMA